MIRYFTLLPLVLLASAPIASARAQSSYADLAAIDAQVRAFAGSAAGSAAPVDRRLRLMPCPVPLALAWYGERQETVEVRCPTAPGWKIFVNLIGRAAGSFAPTAPVVSRGDQVTITIAGQGFAVSQQGEALEAGTQGAWIKVRGLSAGARVIRARVLRPGQVGMDLP